MSDLAPSLAGQVAADSDIHFRIDVRSARTEGGDLVLEARLITDAFFHCPNARFIIRAADSGQILHHQEVDPQGRFLGPFKSGTAPCEASVVARIPGGASRQVRLELYPDQVPTSELESQPRPSRGAVSPPLTPEDLGTAARQRSGPSGPIEAAIQSVVRPVLLIGGAMLGGTFLIQNMDTIAELFDQD